MKLSNLKLDFCFHRVKKVISTCFLIVLALVFWGCDLFSSEDLPQERARELYEQGLVAFEKKNYNQAATFFNNAIRLDSKQGEYYQQHGLASVKCNKSGEAVMSLARACELMPDNMKIRMQLALVYEELGKPKQAIEQIKSAMSCTMSEEYTSTDLLKKITELYIKARQFDDAQQSISKLLLISPGDVDIICLQADLMLNQGKALSALKNLQKAVGVTPDEFRVHWTLGRHLTNLHRDEEAIKELEIAISMQSNNIQARLDLGKVYLKLNRPGQAQKQFQAVLDIQPQSLNAQVGLAWVYLQQGKTDEALLAAEKVIALRPTFIDAHEILGEIYLAKGEEEAAVKGFTRVLEINPERISAYIGLARLYEKGGNRDQAIAELERALIHQPDDVRAKRMLASLYLKQGKNLQTALQYVNEQLKETKLDLEMLKIKAEILLSLGNCSQALVVAEQALKITPDELDLRELQARISDTKSLDIGKKPRKTTPHHPLKVEIIRPNIK